MKHAVFHFHGALNDFLPSGRRDRDFPYEFDGKPSVKDAVEAVGVPHVEVDVIVLNGRSVPFTAHLRDGDRLEAFSPDGDAGIPDAVHLWPEPPCEPRFVLDVHLGKLARYLRLLGFDARHDPRFDDPDIAAIALEQDRIALTRDIMLLKIGAIRRGYWIRSQNPREQLREIVRRYRLAPKTRPFTRCTVCNGLIREVPVESVRDRLQPKTLLYYHRFFRCTSCGRIYWEGSHYPRMRELVEEVEGGSKDQLTPGPSLFERGE